MSTRFCVVPAPRCSASVPLGRGARHAGRGNRHQLAAAGGKLEGAHGALINIAGPTDLKLQEAAAAVALVQKAIHPEAQIIWGLSLDDAYGDEVRVTVIAAGFDANSKKPDQPAEEKPAAAKENTVPLSALSAGVQAPAQQPQPVQTPAVPQVQPLSSYIPSTPDQNVASFDQTTEHEVVSANDPGDLDIPDFLR